MQLEEIQPALALSENGVFDIKNSLIQNTQQRITNGLTSDFDKTKTLFYFVRDKIKYSMFVPFFKREHYKASLILSQKAGYCVQKAVLLTTLLRATGIPSVLLFADIINHKSPSNVFELMGTNYFTYHGYTAAYINHKWIKLTPAFDIEMCKKVNYPTVEFNKPKDAVFSPTDSQGNKFIEYSKLHGAYTDLPINEILTAWETVYTKKRIDTWKNFFKNFPT